MMLGTIMEQATNDGGFDGAPWEERNWHRYLVDETLSPLAPVVLDQDTGI